MKRLLLTLLLMLVFAPTASAQSGGCAAGWHPVDAQTWWYETQFGPDPEMDARHLHTGGCIPRREITLSGTVGFDVVVKMHNDPGRITYVAIVVKTDTLEKTYQSVNPGWTCPTADCTFIRHFDLPVSAFDKSGLEEIRFRATSRQPDGNEMRTSVNFQTHISNGKPLDHFGRMPYIRGKGWYTGLNYCESAFRTDLTPLPIFPVPDLWEPNIRQIDHGSSDADPTWHSIRLNPDIHNGDSGERLTSAPGPRDGVFPIDTTADEFYYSGFYSLMIETECTTAAGTNTGVLVLPFEVN